MNTGGFSIEHLGLIAFGLFLLFSVVLDICMIVSLVRQGDERRQLMVWKAGTWTLVGTTGGLVLSIIECIARNEAVSVNPFIVLSSAAILYFVVLLIYKRKYGG